MLNERRKEIKVEFSNNLEQEDSTIGKHHRFSFYCVFFLYSKDLVIKEIVEELVEKICYGKRRD